MAAPSAPPGRAGLILTGLGTAVVLAQFSWGLMLWLVPISIGVALFAVAIARARVLSRIAATLFGTGLLLTAAPAFRYGLVTPEGEDPIWPYGPMWPSSLIGIAVFGLGLTWLGWQLRSEHPVDTNQGMAPAT
jgi:hypothetical protein